MTPKKQFLAALFLCIFNFGISQKVAVYFPNNSATLDKPAKALIDSVFKMGGVIRVNLKGHCDSIGTSGFNDGLSKKRVEEVRKYLVSKRVADSLIHVEALGEISSMIQNQTEEKRAKNRRVDIEVQRKQSVMPKPALVGKEISVFISGTILDEFSNPIVAEVSLSDERGKDIQTTTSDKNGNYAFKATVNTKYEYSLTYYNDSTFVETKNLTFAEGRGSKVVDLKTVLPKLKAGTSHTFENLNFYGSEARLLPKSLPSLRALYKLMKRNHNLVIRIEGHVNDPAFPGRTPDIVLPGGQSRKEHNQWLSDQRAKTVYDYLAEHGIEKKRMSKNGYGATKMLFPVTSDEREMAQNRRVEIFVVSF